MDYPISVPGVGLVNGEFVDENPATGQVGSLIPAAWANSLTKELLNLIRRAGMEPDEEATNQVGVAVDELIAAKIDGKLVRALSVGRQLTADDMGLLLLDASAANGTYTLPASNAELGIRDVILRRTDNSGNRLVVQVTGTDRIKFHTHLRAEGYPFLVLMGAGDYWHLRSDGTGNWWPIARLDSDALGRPVFETTTLFSPGGWGALAGAVLQRAEWPWLWDHAQQSGVIVTEEYRVGKEGGWTTGDGVSTFRGPEARGEYLRVLDDGRGVDPDRMMGSWAEDTTRAHRHAVDGNYASPGAAGNNYGTTVLDGQASPLPQSSYTELYGDSETSPRSIAYPGRIKLI